ncbi:uncharacterized protein EI97DRAFT_434692 [Westerdykella ornata]|uniref:Uncharacterized protein n=1 Tax=Westerdykella ornata TaxID=318751 RepID=A0A6A6JEW9_WESOR|nr:uncharacterized protein EI97DRAFT_434692 [Westerdykella ornata]KAF2274784.1 hypothetical protein EI97DRAFT_434692 [Westerdykella ornata]
MAEDNPTSPKKRKRDNKDRDKPGTLKIQSKRRSLRQNTELPCIKETAQLDVVNSPQLEQETMDLKQPPRSPSPEPKSGMGMPNDGDGGPSSAQDQPSSSEPQSPSASECTSSDDLPLGIAPTVTSSHLTVESASRSRRPSVIGSNVGSMSPPRSSRYSKRQESKRRDREKERRRAGRARARR